MHLAVAREAVIAYSAVFILVDDVYVACHSGTKA